MPLEILAPMVVFGIALAWFMVRTLVNAPVRYVSSGDAATLRFLQDFPLTTPAGGWLISDDQRVAFSHLDDEQTIAMVMAFGSKQLTRRLGAADVTGYETGDGHVVVKLNDFTLPLVRVQLGQTSQRERLIDMLKPLLPASHSDGGAGERATLS